MINFEFKKNYNINVVLAIIFGVIAVAITIVAVVIKSYYIIATDVIEFVVAGFFLYRYFKFKKQFLKFDENGFDGYVITVKGSKPMAINGNLNFIRSAHCEGHTLVLTNERGQDLKIYNLVDAKKATQEINDFLNNHRTIKAE